MNARMIFVAVSGFFVLCSSTLSADLNEGLISHWQFEKAADLLHTIRLVRMMGLPTAPRGRQAKSTAH